MQFLIFLFSVSHMLDVKLIWCCKCDCWLLPNLNTKSVYAIMGIGKGKKWCHSENVYFNASFI